MFRKKKSGFTNWVTRPDGTIEQSSIVVRQGGIVDGIYEIEVLDGAIGVVLETDFYCQHTIVKSIDLSRRYLLRMNLLSDKLFCDAAIQPFRIL